MAGHIPQLILQERYEDAKDKELVLEQLKSRLEVFLEETFIPNIQAELESAAI